MNPALLSQISEPARAEISRIYRGSQEENARLKMQVKLLGELLRLARIERFGAGSERLSDGQLALLETEPCVMPQEVASEAALPEVEKEAKPVVGKPVRQSLPAELPRRERIIACAPAECRCRQCGEEKKLIGYEQSERLGVDPVVYFVEVTKREKRACARCEELGVVTAPVPAAIIEKGLGTDALVADVIIKKFSDHLPLYRQAIQIARDGGVELSESTLCGWVMHVGGLLRLVNEAMRTDLLRGGYIQADETTVPVQVRGSKSKGANHQGYLWEYSRPNGPVTFEFRMGRERAGPQKFLEKYHGILQSDGYGAYDKIGGSGMRHAACMAHARRKFFDALQVDPKDLHSARVLKKMGELYEIERAAREAGLDAPARLAQRQEHSLPRIEELKELIIEARMVALPKSALGKACSYALNLWTRLVTYSAHGEVEIDNNWCENAIRPVALGRKNWLHLGSEQAGPKMAAIAAVIETCKRHRIDVRRYLSDVLPRLADWPAHRVAELTPLAWKAAQT